MRDEIPLPPIPLRPGETIDVHWLDGGDTLAFVLNERGSAGVWFSRVTYPARDVLNDPVGSAHVVRRLLDETLRGSKKRRQMATS